MDVLSQRNLVETVCGDSNFKDIRFDQYLSCIFQNINRLLPLENNIRNWHKNFDFQNCTISLADKD